MKVIAYSASTPLGAISLDHLAFVTGHKLTGDCRRVDPVHGLRLFVKLDGKSIPATEARARLEAEYVARGHAY